MHGKVELERERCELATIVAGAVEMAKPLITQREHRLSVSAPERGLTVNADQARLTRAIVNLLTNAAKYTKPGGAIAINAHADGGDALIRVSDSGAGIAPELLPRIFEPFVQGSSALDRSRGGLGIGLTVVNKVVSMHDGSVSAHSAGLGRGSEFIVRLPRAEPNAGVATTGAVDATPDRGREPSRVVVVDDNRDAAEMLAGVLEKLGCSVQVAYDGASALAVLAKSDPQLVLLDIGLPGMDGYEVARRLRASHPASRIVAVTGYGQPSDRARSQEAGFDDHLVKPVSLMTLRQVLDRHLTTPSPAG